MRGAMAKWNWIYPMFAVNERKRKRKRKQLIVIRTSECSTWSETRNTPCHVTSTSALRLDDKPPYESRSLKPGAWPAYHSALRHSSARACKRRTWPVDRWVTRCCRKQCCHLAHRVRPLATCPQKIFIRRKFNRSTTTLTVADNRFNLQTGS